MLGGESRRLPPGLAEAVDRRVSIGGDPKVQDFTPEIHLF